MRFEFSRDWLSNPWSGEIQLVPECEDFGTAAAEDGAFLYETCVGLVHVAVNKLIPIEICFLNKVEN